MQESSVYQHFLQATEERYKQGFQRGLEISARQTALESLFSVLDFKFNSITVRMLRPLLEDIGDIQILMDLQKKALQSQNREDFIQHLERIEDISIQV